MSSVTTAETASSWEDIDGIPTPVLRGTYAFGFETPSPIQSKATGHVVAGRDILAQAQSGTGKTGCFVVGTLSRVDPQVDKPQVLVLSPTRELARQTAHVASRIGAPSAIRVATLVGGGSTDEDTRALNCGAHYIVGCPGRVYDMLRRQRLSPSGIKSIVIDEADELLADGFSDQLYMIFRKLPNDAQVCLFSATLPTEVIDISSRFMKDPVRVTVKQDQLTLEGIAQYFVAMETDEDKLATLKDLYASFSLSQCIIYCNSTRRVETLYAAMMEDDFPVCRIHSGMEQRDRAASYAAFSRGDQRVLVSSNVTARGIDIQQVSTVINFDFPTDPSTYLHRIGRSGRWGRKGTAINLVTSRDTRNVREVETHFSTRIEELPQSFVAE